MALPTRHYTLKLVNSSGQVLNYLRDTFASSYVQTLNQSPTLDFSLPSTSITLSTLVRPNEVWLYDSLNVLVEKFRILRTSISRANDGSAAIQVSCDSYLNQLTDELVSSYQASPVDAFTITEIIEDLLALQVNTSPIVYDATLIDADLASLVRSVNLENQTILRSINALLETSSTPYYIYVNPANKKLNIVASLGSSIGQEIRLGKNLSAISQEKDYSTLCTRLLAVGSGSEDVEVRLTPMGLIPNIYWSFNGTPNDLMSGAAGTYDLTPVGSPVYSDKLGPTNGDSIILNGTSQYLSHASSLARQYASRTVSGFFKLTSIPVTTDRTIFAEQSTASNNPVWTIECTTTAKLQIRINSDAGAVLVDVEGTTTLVIDTWYHFALTDTGTSCRALLNGVQEIAAQAYVGTVTTNLSTLGARKLIASTTRYFPGELACIRIHNSIVSDANLLIDAVTTNKFIDSTAKTSYGIVPRAISDRSVTHPDTLFLAALTYLYANDEPFTAYKVSTLDLTKVPGASFTSFESIALGSTVRLIDSGLSISESQIATRKTIDLSTPINVSFEFSSLTRLITDPNAIYSTINLVQSQAVETIGAGQVIVRGTFTVLNWVTDGSTTIDGDNLTTGTITADKINVGELSAIAISTGDLEVQGEGATPGTINLPSGGVIKSGMSAFAVGDGFWMDNSGGTSRFAFGSTANGQLVPDSGFDVPSAWYAPASTVTITSSQAQFVASAVGDYAVAIIPMVQGESYEVVCTIDDVGDLGTGAPTKTMNVALGGTLGAAHTGSFTETIIAGSDNEGLVIRTNAGTSVDFKVGGITVTGPNADLSSIIKWNGSNLTVVGDIAARSINVGILYANRIPYVDNVDNNDEYLRTNSPYSNILTTIGSFTSGNASGSSAIVSFYTPTSQLPLDVRVVCRLFTASTGPNTVGTQTLAIQIKLDGTTVHTINFTEGGAQNFFLETAAFNITSGASHTFQLVYTFSASDLGNGFILDQIRIQGNTKGDHEVTS